MKLILKYISIFTIVLLAFSCDFDENGSLPEGMEETCFPYIAYNAAASDAFINLTTPEAYSFSGTIDVLFKEGVPFDKLRLVVAYNGAYDEAGTIEDNIVTVPYDITVSSSNMVSVLSSLSSLNDLEAGDWLHVYVIPTIGGKEYPPYQVLGGKAYSTTSASIGQNLTAFTGLTSADVVVNVPCELKPAMMVGSYYMASDDWAAWGDVTIEADPANPFKVFIYGAAGAEGLVDNGNGIEINIDPVTYAASGVKTVLSANLAPWGLGGYTNYYYQPNTVSYNTCNGSYSMVVRIGVDQGSWGNFNYLFTRND